MTFNGITPRITPQILFAEFTFLDDEGKEAINKQCIEWIKDTNHPNVIPGIDYSPRHERWIWHSLTIDGLIYKKECAKLFRRPNPRGVESDLEDEISEFLEDRGIAHRRQVQCEAGVADIVADSVVIEVKTSLSNEGWFKAIGQAIGYRISLQLPRAAIVSLSPPPHWARRSCQLSNIECFNEDTMADLASYIEKGVAP
uniref:Uncharacterized protein n=1 Tax=viral metagenome TaxID=1070528 RepID=A0A6M3L3T2_9ZZZZ